MANFTTWATRPTNIKEVLRLYRSKAAPTQADIASQLNTSVQNVIHVLGTHMELSEKKALARRRYARSKTGAKNPMTGKAEAAHHNWKGDCADGYGYLTRIYLGKRRFVHQIVLMEALKITTWPQKFVIHHIDEDKTNNSLDNLAIVTRAGHRRIHCLQAVSKPKATSTSRKSKQEKS